MQQENTLMKNVFLSACGVSIDLSVLNNRKVMVRGEVTGDFCPEETICMSSCSKVGVFVHTVSALD